MAKLKVQRCPECHTRKFALILRGERRNAVWACTACGREEKFGNYRKIVRFHDDDRFSR